MAKASPPSIAATSTLAMVRAAEARGVQTAGVLADAGLTRAVLEDPDARIPARTVLALWNVLRQRTGDPALQLTAPHSLPFGAYRIIDYVVTAQATVGEGIRRFADFFRLIADAVELGIEEEPGEYRLCVRMAGGGAVAPVYVDYILAALITRIRGRIGPALRILRVELRQPEPLATAPYAELFRAPVRFGAAADRLCFRPEDWDAPMAGGDGGLARLLEAHARILAQRLPQATPPFTAEVQKAIASAPPEAGSAADVARALHVSVRTLQRRLVESGTSFRELSETVRGELAREYLAGRTVSIVEVALLLGFSEQSSFNRAFRRWTGESPGRWRKRRV